MPTLATAVIGHADAGGSAADVGGNDRGRRTGHVTDCGVPRSLPFN